MKRNNDLSISPNPSADLRDEICTPTLYRLPLSPGCPTDSKLYSRRHQSSLRTPLSAFMTVPRTAATMARRRSTNPEDLQESGPTTGFGDVLGTSASEKYLEQWRIRPGTFVVFELDTDFVMEQLECSLRGDVSLRDVKTESGWRFLGLVLWSHTYVVQPPEEGKHEDDPGSGEIVEEIVVNFVASTPPPAPLQSHCVPIAPAKITFNDPAEQPLQTTTLFPFPDLYQWTTLGTRLEVRNVYDSSLHFGLKEDEFMRLDERVAEDYKELGLVREDEIEKLKVSMYTIPAKVWRDVREAAKGVGGGLSGTASKEGQGSAVLHPEQFVDQVEELTRQVAPKRLRDPR